MSTTTDALDAACVLLTEDRYLVQALSACRRGRGMFQPDYEQEPKDVSEHLEAVELEAQSASNMCANAGLVELANSCKRISDRIRLARRQGTDDTCAVADLSRLTTAGQEELDIQCDEYASNSSRI